MLADTWWTCGPLPSAAPEATSVWVERQSEVVPSHILTPEYQHVLGIGQGVHQPSHRRDLVEATNGRATREWAQPKVAWPVGQKIEGI